MLGAGRIGLVMTIGVAAASAALSGCSDPGSPARPDASGVRADGSASGSDARVGDAARAPELDAGREGPLDAGPRADGGSGTYPTFERDIVPILNRSCGGATAGCHDRGAYGTGDASRDCRGWLSLTDEPLGGAGCAPRDLYARLVELDAWGCDAFDPRVRYVRPCEPENSYLLRKIAGGPYCRSADGAVSLPMPMVGTVPPAEVELIEAWILAGAPRDGEPRSDCAAPPVGSAPELAILHPATGEERRVGRPIPFTLSAVDSEDGDLGASVIVTSDVEGEIGRGRMFGWTPSTLGAQVITASVTDSDARTDTASITLNIVP